MKNQKVNEGAKLQRVEYALRMKRAHKQGKIFLTAEGLKKIDKWVK